MSAFFFLGGAGKFLWDYKKLGGVENILIGCIAFYLGLASLLLPFTYLWGLGWWILEGLQFIPILMTFVYIVSRFRAMQLGLIVREKELEALNKQLTISNQELEKFSAVASHDLKSPLNTISQFVELTTQATKKEDNGKIHEYLKFISDATKRMRQLIDDLLNFARTNTPPEFAKISLDEILDEVLKNLEKEISSAHAKITCIKLPRTMGDRAQLVQLFQNLLGNAVKYHGEKPPEIKLLVRDENAHWIFSVEDNGIGIDKQYAEKIFQPFQRLHTYSEYSGTGLGLSICKNIVERHGGKIWVESKKGHGTTFYFDFPK